MDRGYDTALDLFDDLSELPYKLKCSRKEGEPLGLLHALATFGVRIELRSSEGDMANLESILLQLAGKEVRWNKHVGTSATHFLLECAKKLHRDLKFEALLAESYKRVDGKHRAQMQRQDTPTPPVAEIWLGESKPSRFLGAGLFWEFCAKVSVCLAERFAQARVKNVSRAFEPFVSRLIDDGDTLSAGDVKRIKDLTEDTCPFDSWCADVYKKLIHTCTAVLGDFQYEAQSEWLERIPEVEDFIDSHLPPETILDETVHLLQIEFANAARLRLQRGQELSVQRNGESLAASDQAEDLDRSASDRELDNTNMRSVLHPRTNDIEHTSDSLAPRLALCAIGVELSGRWHRFRKKSREWQHWGRLEQLSRGTQEKLLLAFSNGGGFLAKRHTIETIRDNFSAADVDPIMNKTIKPALTRIRNVIRKAFGLQKQVDPLPFDKNAKGWRAAIQIGYAVQEDREHIGGEYRLRFKTHEELSPDERADF